MCGDGYSGGRFQTIQACLIGHRHAKPQFPQIWEARSPRETTDQTKNRFSPAFTRSNIERQHTSPPLLSPSSIFLPLLQSSLHLRTMLDHADHLLRNARFPRDAMVQSVPQTQPFSFPPGLSVWTTVGSSIRRSIIVPPIQAPSPLTVNSWMLQSINWIGVAAIFVVMGIAAVPIAFIVVLKCMKGSSANSYTLSKRASLLLLSALSFTSIIAFLTGIESSVYVSSALQSTESASSSLVSRGLGTVAFLPAMARTVVSNITSDANTVVQRAFDVVDTTEFQLQLVGKNKTGPGELLILLCSQWVNITSLITQSGGSVQSNLDQIASRLDRLKKDFLALRQIVQILNEPIQSTSRPTVFYKLNQPIPSPSLDVVNTAIDKANTTASTLDGSIPLALSTLNASLPDIAALLPVLTPTIRNVRAAIATAATAPLQSKIADMIRNASDPAVRDVDAFAAAARGTVASANGTMVATVADVRAYDRVRAAVSATLLVVSTVAMVGVFLVPFFRGPVGATIFIVVLAASTAILLIFAALAFTTTGALGEGCTFATDKSARFIASVNADVGAKLQSFHATRSACLGPNATSLLDAASALGIVQTSFNISDMAATVINHYDFRQSTSIDLSSIVPQDLLNLDTNSIREKLQGVSLPPSLRQALFSLNASALASENEVLTSAAATLNLSISDGTVLSMVAADGGSAQPTTDDLAVLSAAIAQILGLQAAIRRDIQAVTELRTASIAAVETVAAALSNLQDVGGQLSEPYNTVMDLSSKFASEASKNFTGSIPALKQNLYGIADNSMDNIKANLDCRPMAEDTVTIETLTCSHLNEALDGLWLSFVVSGVTLLVCLSCIGCVSNRLERRTGSVASEVEFERADSTETVSSVVGLLSGKRDYKVADDNWIVSNRGWSSGDASGGPSVAPPA